MEPLFVSIGYFLTIFTITNLTRFILNKTFSSDQFLLRILLEFVTAAELVSVALEFGSVIENYGFLAYSVVFFFVLLWFFRTWGKSSANPCIYWEMWYNGEENINLVSVALITITQLIGGLFAWTFVVVPFWSIKLHSTHAKLLGVMQSQCSSFMKVPLSQAILVEGLGILVLRLFARFSAEKNWKFVKELNAILLVVVVILGIPLTGSFFNPMLATTFQYGCKGVERNEHLIAYWLAPIFGALASLILYNNPLFYKIVMGVPPKKKAE